MERIRTLGAPLFTCEELLSFWAKLDSGEDASCGIAQSARPFMVASRYARVPQATLVIVPGEQAAEDFIRSLNAFLGEDHVFAFPMRSDYPWGEKTAIPSEIAARLQALHILTDGLDGIVVASARALMRLFPPSSIRIFEPIQCGIDKKAEGFSLSFANRELSYDTFIAQLEKLGYEHVPKLEGAGTFVAKGGTVDVFPGNLSYPVRLDFYGDDVEEIRRIIPSTGQTIQDIHKLSIYPVIELKASKRSLARAREALFNPSKTNPVLRGLLEKLEEGIIEKDCDALLPYLYDTPDAPGAYLSKDVLTVLIEPRSLIDDAIHEYDDLVSRATGTSIPVEGLFCAPSDLEFGMNQRVVYQSIMRVGAQIDVEIPVKRTEVAGDPEKLFGRLRNFIESGYTTVLCIAHYRVREDIKLDLVDRGIPFIEFHDGLYTKQNLKEGLVNIVDMDIGLGFVLPKAKLALVSISDTHGAGALRAGKPVDITEITFPFAPGDYVVHAAHGVAFFRELVRRDVAGVERDYLLLEYASNDKLYVPVEQLDRVTRYVGPEGASPRLTRLNTGDWSRVLTRARKASKKLAFDLIDVYTRRAAAKGYSFSADTPWQRQMEEDFPYEETTDQLAAIADVKADMQSTHPMDRLICGDVGFGKTEVALRAAFKACQDAKQVMVLCPTTILAQQHYTSFSERFEPYGIRVEVLSRFRTHTQQHEALEGFATGSVDVLIGTHRLLSRDVNPHDLGLLIIDEEQRFGVGHKEQLKHMRESIDMLTLSATPIPRTLQMSLSGVRDMSLILTPPDDRRPVEVHVGEWDPDLVSGAIGRELDRHGQVYYVSNRVRSIQDALDRVAGAAPSARVGVAHGKMPKEELERVMEEFSAGTIDVLVATTIIESGIDNPHTNTLIIEDAQRLGLAQMYQLKGRVGRSNRQAYAYFMFPEQANLTEEALYRLEALSEYQDLGSGMRIAMRDLEIRGAGTLLGAEQSGNMSAVGFDLFAQLIAQAVTELRGSDSETSINDISSDITINIPEHTYLDSEYIRDGEARVLLYRKLASAVSPAQITLYEEETEQKYGALPQAAKNLFTKMFIKTLACEKGIKTIAVVAGNILIEPIAQPAGALAQSLHKAKIRYLPKTHKLQIPLRYFSLPEDGSLFEAVKAFLLDYFPE